MAAYVIPSALVRGWRQSHTVLVFFPWSPGLETVPKDVLRTHLHVRLVPSALPGPGEYTHACTTTPFAISVQTRSPEPSLRGVGRGRALIGCGFRPFNRLATLISY